MLRLFASCTSRCAHPRTCTTEPGDEPSSGSTTVWMESITTSEGAMVSIEEMMLGNDISGKSQRSGRNAPSRSARRRTCCALSSAVTYNVAPVVCANSCSNKVLFPMPGSPPNKVTEPGTRPPPSTRSNSPRPVETGSLSCELTSAIGVAVPGGTNASPAAKVTSDSSGPSTSSTSEFHAPQARHFPDHLGNDAAHSVQRWTSRSFATTSP